VSREWLVDVGRRNGPAGARLLIAPGETRGKGKSRPLNPEGVQLNKKGVENFY